MPYIKINLLGDSGVGKSSLILRFADNTFTDSFISTIGVASKRRSLKLEGETVTCDVWDHVKTEKFRDHVDNPNKGCHAFIIVCDLTNTESVENIHKWVSMRANDKIPIFLVGTKADLKNEIKVQPKDLEDMAKEYPNCFSLGATSAKNNTSIDASFETIARHVTELTKENAKKKKLEKNATEMPNIQQQLDNYCSIKNTLFAYFKFLFSLGQFSLGVQKLKLVEELKNTLSTTEDKAEVIEEYRVKNRALVHKEFSSSHFFGGNYIKRNNNPDDLSIIHNEGKLGEILENASKSLKK
jgi:Ras-related protein Rab-1A